MESVQIRIGQALAGLFVVLVGVGPTGIAADELDFVAHIQPIFEQYCVDCHGSDRQEANYRLDHRQAAFGMSDSGETPIQPGDSGSSLLMRLVRGQESDRVMPPEDEQNPVSPQSVRLLEQWINQGADWPDDDVIADETQLSTDHWAFQPLASDVVFPHGSYPATNHAIDDYIRRRLVEHDLQPSPKADRVTLIRRVYLDVLGLPPTVNEVRAFVRDSRPTAYIELIDRVLASPHFGERWGRHWLDVVRFGESTGYEVNRDRPNAFHYRDYVVRSLNDDKSFQDFVVEQLAGDVVGVDAATGFLVGGPYDMVKSPDVNLTLMQRQDELADFVNTTATTFLGLTVGCARCHNHKFDPILQRDYYAMQAVFSGVEHGERPLRELISAEASQQRQDLDHKLADTKIQIKALREMAAGLTVSEKEVNSRNRLPPVNARQNVEPLAPTTARLIRFRIHATNSSEPCIDELEIYAVDGKNVALAEHGAVAVSSGDFANNPLHRLEHVHDGKHGNAQSWISNEVGRGWVQIELPQPVTIHKIVWGRDRLGVFKDRLAIAYSIEVAVEPDGDWQVVASSERRQPFPGASSAEDEFIERLPRLEAKRARQLRDDERRLETMVQRLEKTLPVGYVGEFRSPPATFRLYRGDPFSPREQVGPDALMVTGSLNLEIDTPEQQRRLALANWIASPDNPLTARVIVNRVWQYHFGQGIVATPSDFGKNGVPPSHPMLLDWLARRFVEHDWSLKWLHREILLTETYQQSSRPNNRALAVDAACRLLWRFPPRRLEAEAIRDGILFVSGGLNYHAFGPGFLLLRIDHQNVHHYFPLEDLGPDQFRRMIYMMKIRQEHDDVFGVFDCPDGGQVVPNRSRSTTPLQSLNLLNSKFVLQQAAALSERIRSLAGNSVREQVLAAFELTLTRRPTVDELKDAIQLVEIHGLKSLCRALLNSNEFLFMS